MKECIIGCLLGFFIYAGFTLLWHYIDDKPKKEEKK